MRSQRDTKWLQNRKWPESEILRSGGNSGTRLKFQHSEEAEAGGLLIWAAQWVSSMSTWLHSMIPFQKPKREGGKVRVHPGFQFILCFTNTCNWASLLKTNCSSFHQREKKNFSHASHSCPRRLNDIFLKLHLKEKPGFSHFISVFPTPSVSQLDGYSFSEMSPWVLVASSSLQTVCWSSQHARNITTYEWIWLWVCLSLKQCVEGNTAFPYNCVPLHSKPIYRHSEG